MDNLTKEQRKKNMRNIRSTNTKAETRVRKWLFSKGYRYRINDKRYPGKPDIVLPMYKTIILIHGCFWHGHEGCKYFVLPKTNEEYWIPKIKKNVERDLLNLTKLRNMGWNVITVWECEIKKEFEKTMFRIVNSLNK